MKYYYKSKDKTLGPFTEDEFLLMLNEGVINDSTFVWWEGLNDWSAFTDVKNLYFRQSDEGLAVSQKGSVGEPLPEKLNSLRYAGFWIRVLATVFDGILFLAILFAVILFPAFLSSFIIGGPFVDNFNEIVACISYVLIVCFYIFCESKFGGTPGKRMLGLRIIVPSGEKLTVWLCIARRFMKIFSGIFNIGYIMVGLTKEKRGLHDMVCGTRVVYDSEKKG